MRRSRVVCDQLVCKALAFLETCAFDLDTDADGLADGTEDVNGDGQRAANETDPPAPTPTSTACWTVARAGPRWTNARTKTTTAPRMPARPTARAGHGQRRPPGRLRGQLRSRQLQHHPCSTDPLNDDTDGDGLADGEEDTHENPITHEMVRYNCIFERTLGETDPGWPIQSLTLRPSRASGSKSVRPRI